MSAAWGFFLMWLLGFVWMMIPKGDGPVRRKSKRKKK